MPRMAEPDRDTLMRVAAFEHVRRLNEVHDHLTATELKPGFVFDGQRISLINPQRGIFKPQQMQFLLSIKTVFPKPGGKIWYDDQRDVHRQIYEGDESVDYAFMGDDPEAALFWLVLRAARPSEPIPNLARPLHERAAASRRTVRGGRVMLPNKTERQS